MDLKGQWRKTAAAFEQRSTAEKAIIAVLALVTLAWLWWLMLFEPLQRDTAAMQGSIAADEARLASLEARATEARAAAARDPEQAVREQIRRLTEEQQGVDRRIGTLAGRLVSPDEMTGLLTTVLEQQQGMELQRVQNQAPRALRDIDAADEDGRGQLYSHGLVLEFRGSYFDTVRYLNYLESLSSSFFWDRLQFNVETWPTANVVLELHTLSLEEGFVGFGVQ